jgi:AhpD family alkylhydroperoxidase
MKQRMNMAQSAPDAYKALLAFDKYLSTTQLTPIHLELIRMRASQINGCAFCLDMHSHSARKQGETDQRIFTLSAWRDTSFFDEEERAILALTEAMTLIHQNVSDAVFDQARSVLGEAYLVQVMMAVIIINSWNRLGVTTHLQPAVR